MTCYVQRIHFQSLNFIWAAKEDMTHIKKIIKKAAQAVWDCKDRASSQEGQEGHAGQDFLGGAVLDSKAVVLRHFCLPTL